MKRTEATVYVAFWVSIAAMVIFGNRSCDEDAQNRRLVEQQKWLAQREDCSKRNGLFGSDGWGGWKCGGLK